MLAQNIREYRSQFPLLLRFLDGVVIVASFYIAHALLGKGLNDRSLTIGLVGVLMYFFSAELSGVFRQDRSRTPSREIFALSLTWGATMLLVSGFLFFTKQGELFSRAAVIGWAFLGLNFVTLYRMTLRGIIESMCRKGLIVRRCAIAGLNPLGLQLARSADENPIQGLKVIGFFDDRDASRRETSPEGMPSLNGRLNDLVNLARKGEIDTVFVTLPMRAENRIRQLLDQLSDTTASVYIVPDFFVFELLHSRWTNVGGLPAVSVFETPLYGVDGWMKRALDLVAATVGLILISPLMLLIAILVKLSSAGPVFFRQKRYGLDGKEILVWKFRSMRTCDNGPVVKQATKNDPRITPIGSFLRKSSLDELPQLFNVIEGTMSLVGPRPHASAHNEQYRKLIRGYMLRHKVRPGITGMAQVSGCRGETETLEKMERRIELDHRYIREWSLWLDISILFRTLLVVWKQPSAY